MPAKIVSELVQLARLARDGGLDLSQVSLRVKTDLLLSTPNPPANDVAAFIDLALAMIPTIDEATATILARKLAGWPGAPDPVLQALALRGGPVLAALLRHGMPTPAGTLEDLACEGAPAVAAGLAARPDLSVACVLMLAARDDLGIDLVLMANAAATLPRAALDLLLARARHRPAYAPLLLARADLTDAELAPLYLHARAERRQSMREALRGLEALAPSARPAPPTPELLSGWVATAGEDREGAFGAIALHLGGGQALAQAMSRDLSRDMTAIALIAAGLRIEDATRFLIRLGDETAHSVERIFALVEAMRVLEPAVALRLVRQISGETMPAASRRREHQPAMDPSGTPARAAAARPDNRSILDTVIGKLGPRRSRG